MVVGLILGCYGPEQNSPVRPWDRRGGERLGEGEVGRGRVGERESGGEEEWGRERVGERERENKHLFKSKPSKNGETRGESVVSVVSVALCKEWT